MVSALASSSVTFPRSVSVKVLVSDCDLLQGKEDKLHVILHLVIFSLGTVGTIKPV